MTRVALLDVNVLVALFDPDHIHMDVSPPGGVARTPFFSGSTSTSPP